jgi:BirA family biotin operon repressor/biotin-[acetyl-CoA-carboxylase] ligase
MLSLTAVTIEQAITTRRLGHPALAFDAIGSTNDVAHEKARGGAADGLLVVADEQTAGRGRLERTWWAPPHTCLLMSLLLRPGPPPGVLPLQRVGQLTMCLGLGAVEGIADITGLHAGLKWPNDVLVGERKLGGMLTELSTKAARLDYAVLGLGLNVNIDFAAEDCPPDVAAGASSLSAEVGHSVDRLALLAAILEHTESWYERVLVGESPHEAWAERLDTLGHRVRVSLVNGALEGVALGITPEGGLLVRDDAGAVHTVWSGDVVAVR